ncbi:hypothetical protein J1N35_039012 [Gossypium stocksii]|uniref:Uncharacterized protein n=1 Tax=Gossypium stocksii TaxID=47602 RepID=A0A9D3ZN77_9ROSI|nr:hypothetical protein J1N35_039012 [Gossypium stocksii]
MGHVAKECTDISKLRKESGEDDLPYSLALKAESNLVGRESLQLGNIGRKFMEQCLYTREKKERDTSAVKLIEDIITNKEQITPDLGHTRISNKTVIRKTNKQESLEIIESRGTEIGTLLTEIEQPWEEEKAKMNIIAIALGISENHKKLRWKRKGRIWQITDIQMETVTCKRKCFSNREESPETCFDSGNDHKKARMEINISNYHVLEKLAHIIVTTSLKQKKMIYLLGEVPCYAKRQAEMERPREPD